MSPFLLERFEPIDHRVNGRAIRTIMLYRGATANGQQATRSIITETARTALPRGGSTSSACQSDKLKRGERWVMRKWTNLSVKPEAEGRMGNPKGNNTAVADRTWGHKKEKEGKQNEPQEVWLSRQPREALFHTPASTSTRFTADDAKGPS